MTTKRISELAISLPFSISSYGKVSSTSSQEKIWADRVRVAIGTAIRERIMRPTYGSTIPYEVFNNQSDVAGKIASEIERVFENSLTFLSLSHVDVAIDDVNSVVSANVTYSLPNQDSVTTNIGLANISGNSPLTEENL